MNIYKSLKSKRRDGTLPKTTNSMHSSGVEKMSGLSENHPNSLNGEIEILEKVVVEGLGKLKTTVNAYAATSLEQIRQSQQLGDGLKADIATLQAKLEQTEEAIAKQDSSREELKKTLTAEIESLQSRLNAKDESLTKREKELSEYKTKADNNGRQINELQLAIHKANEQVAGQAKAVDAVTKSLHAKITELEALLKKPQAVAEEEVSTIEELTAPAEKLETIINDKKEHFMPQDVESNELTAKSKHLTIGFGETSAFTGISAEPVANTAAQHRPITGPETSTPGEFGVTKVASIVEPRDTVSPDLLKLIVSELAEFTNVMESLASLLVRRHMKHLGESIERFPLKRLPELFEALATEVSGDNRQIDFRQRLAQRTHITLT